MKTFRLLLVVFALTVYTTIATAQTATAQLTQQGAVRVDTQQPLQSAYSLDATNFHFESEKQAIAYFADKQLPYVTFRPVFHKNVIMVYPQISSKPDWITADWNNYLAANKIAAEAKQPTNQLTK